MSKLSALWMYLNTHDQNEIDRMQIYQMLDAVEQEAADMISSAELRAADLLEENRKQAEAIATLRTERDAARRELEQARTRITELEGYIDTHNKKALASLDEALNSGIGTYRP